MCVSTNTTRRLRLFFLVFGDKSENRIIAREIFFVLRRTYSCLYVYHFSWFKKSGKRLLYVLLHQGMPHVYTTCTTTTGYYYYYYYYYYYGVSFSRTSFLSLIHALRENCSSSSSSSSSSNTQKMNVLASAMEKLLATNALRGLYGR